MLSSHIALLHQEHLEAAPQVMLYLLLQHNLHLCMDPTYWTIDGTQFPMFEWSDFYGEVKEPIPPNLRDTIGKLVDLHMFVNSDHAGDQNTHQSHSGFPIYLLILP